jgi:hypothetical protein
MPRQGAVSLSDLISPTLTLVCGKCGRKGVYSVARLQAKHTDLRGFLTADYPERARKSIDAQCQAAFDPVPETRPKSSRVRGNRSRRKAPKRLFTELTRFAAVYRSDCNKFAKV